MESSANEHAPRILVVDDIVDLADTLADVLRLDGYNVCTAPNGREALAMVRSFRPDCVLLDVEMPVMDGLALTRELRHLYGDDVVLIAMSGGDPNEPTVASTFERVDHYFRKPISAEQLRKVLPRQ